MKKYFTNMVKHRKTEWGMITLSPSGKCLLAENVNGKIASFDGGMTWVNIGDMPEDKAASILLMFDVWRMAA